MRRRYRRSSLSIPRRELGTAAAQDARPGFQAERELGDGKAVDGWIEESALGDQELGGQSWRVDGRLAEGLSRTTASVARRPCGRSSAPGRRRRRTRSVSGTAGGSCSATSAARSPRSEKLDLGPPVRATPSRKAPPPRVAVQSRRRRSRRRTRTPRRPWCRPRRPRRRGRSRDRTLGVLRAVDRIDEQSSAPSRGCRSPPTDPTSSTATWAKPPPRPPGRARPYVTSLATADRALALLAGGHRRQHRLDVGDGGPAAFDPRAHSGASNRPEGSLG